MSLEIKFELQDSDLEYFRDVMRKALAGAEKLDEADILQKAKDLSGEVQGSVPEFVSKRLVKLETLIAMVEDSCSDSSNNNQMANVAYNFITRKPLSYMNL